jgi:hypothetical protein
LECSSPGVFSIDFSALSNETEFAVYASSSTDNVRTGDENVFFEPPAPGMQSMESLVDVLQLGQGMNALDYVFSLCFTLIIVINRPCFDRRL